MNQTNSKDEREHLGRVKSLPCSVCGDAAPSEAHHIKQSNAYSCVALCASCHRDPKNGWHGQKALWRVYKMDELDALIITFKGLLDKTQ